MSCQSFGACSYQAQLFDRPSVWVVPHQLLFQAQSALGEVAGVVIDESFWQAGYKAPRKGLTLGEIGYAPPLKGPFLDTIADVAAYRSWLAAALRRQESVGGVARIHLAAEGIDAELCTNAIAAEWRLKGSAEIWPGMGEQARRAAAKAAAGTKHVRSYVAVWTAARDLLQRRDDEAAVSGRLLLADLDTEGGAVGVVRTTGIRPIASAWADAPTLALDATLPALAILREFYPEMEVVADIEARTPHATVRQVIGAATSANKLMRSEAERNLGEVRRALLHRFVDFGRASTLVVAQKAVAEWLRASVLPAGIEVAHFHAIAGLDGFKGIRLFVVVGRTLPNVVEGEAIAGAVTGLEVIRTAEPEKGPRWYDKAPLGIRMANGTGYPVQGDRHPDPTAEAIRRQICEDDLVQATSRTRAVNWTAEMPVQIEI